MKKNYQKPSIYVEEFELAQSIAVNCHLTPDPSSTTGHPTHNNPGVDNCNWVVGGTIIFTESSGCNLIEDPDGFSGDGFCYNAPQDQIQIFASA